MIRHNVSDLRVWANVSDNQYQSGLLHWAANRIEHLEGLVKTPAFDALRDLFAQLDLPRRERLALEALADAHPRIVSNALMIEAMYEAVGEEAENPEAIIHSHISKLRTKIAPHGWKILNRRFQGYRLVLASEARHESKIARAA